MRLNLLPPDKQQNLQRTIMAQFIKNIFELAFLVTCIIAIGLLGGQWVLQNYFHDITASTLSVSTGPNERTTRINEVNAILRNANAAQKGYTLWTPTLIELHEVIPDNVVITQISMNTQGKKATIMGRAETRDALLELERALESLDFLGEIEIPISQLTQQENIPFTFNPELNL